MHIRRKSCSQTVSCTCAVSIHKNRPSQRSNETAVNRRGTLQGSTPSQQKLHVLSLADRENTLKMMKIIIGKNCTELIIS